ncbi:hypothetical protein FBUS_06518 [Fasciolopsis buskii]|uniref:Uncharacterized protein n=1 Tax=Fasciolopsis buskii TaxID=27845 RepID=A0A8E0VI34_9TREM|nr:hypothetical protein FBUS_06518 [Fasciolopsis buski]
MVVSVIYWYKNYGCTCPRVVGVSMIPTESGLYKPFDRGVGACVRQCCSLPPSFTEFVTRPGRMNRGWTQVQVQFANPAEPPRRCGLFFLPAPAPHLTTTPDSS